MGTKLKEWRRSRKLVLCITAMALLIDNTLVTVVVPILPNFLLEIERSELQGENTTTPSMPPLLNSSSSSTSSSLWPSSSSSLNTTPPLSTPTSSPPSSSSSSSSSYNDESVAIGLLFASKSLVQFISNPIVGPITNRIGYSLPLITGFVIMFISTMTFALGRTYWVLLVARSVQGFGSSCSSVSSMGMLASLYTGEEERGHAMGIALGGIAFGVSIGPTYGGLMYEFFGKEAPFFVLAGVALVVGVFALFIIQPALKQENQKGSPLIELLTDPYILIAAVSICLGSVGIASLEPTLPLHMLQTIQSSKWEQGIVFLPCSITYLIGTNVFGSVAYKFGRWLSALLGFLLIGVSLIFLPLANHLAYFMIPLTTLGFGIGMVDSAMMPMMAHLVDLRHLPIYGSVYAISDATFRLGFIIGPAVSGPIIKGIEFKGLMWMLATINILYSPMHLFLRNPPAKEEIQVSE
ncbi:hypothetical protein HELRODRAFT_81350 [Helobdella robusta]|uniref:Major facilitator superfamily (MFS) profile domain-containing protein n=1 Tax=Helobdella robusta TaxID=6412 RepID=T1G4D5_HELRO|nr:hypothetical protein HELRODRAFT_81350 [Helobdella robusta]ESO01698.1 hypothetical protein HELRODRAFT_81350 [Helobdella robusta]